MATKTVVLMDHREGLLDKTDQTVLVDVLSASKSKWTVLMEATVEYTRILMDVCGTNHPVMVMTADHSLKFLNTWQNQEGMCKIVETLAVIGPPKSSDKAQPDLTAALQQCIDMGFSNSLLDVQEILLGGTPLQHARIVCFTAIDNPNYCVDIVNDYLESSKNEGTIELVVFNMVTGKESIEYCETGHVIHNVKAGNLFQRVLDSVIKFHNLTITTITSIPMKEEQSTNTQAAAYNVDIVHPVVEIPGCPKERLTMKWSSPKNAQNINLRNCVATYPVTPLDVAERPTICLVNFLLVGKQVVLEFPKPNLSVVLINHGGTIVMHYIGNAKKSISDDLTPIVDTHGGKVTDYRNEEMQMYMRNLELCPHPPPQSVECELPVSRSLLELERYTASFPLTYSSSPLDSCGISRIFSILCKDTLSDKEVTECQQAIYRVQGIEVKKEPISFKSKSGKRDGAILELWEELERLILSMAHISSQHGKVRDCLYKISGGAKLSEDSLYVSNSQAVKSPVKEAASNPLKRGVDQLEDTPSSPTSVPAIKMAKTASLHPSIAGEKVSLMSILPKLVCKEFAGKLSGVCGPDGLYAEFQQKKHSAVSGIKKSSPYNSPHQSPHNPHQSPHRSAPNQSPGHRTYSNPHR